MIYRQFSLTIVVGHGPVGAGRTDPHAGALRDNPQARRSAKHEGNGPLARFFRWFNGRFDRARVSTKRSPKDDRRNQALRARLRRDRRGHGIRSSGGCRPASCPRRTPARCSRWSPSPPARRLPRTDRALDQVRDYFLTKEKANVDGVFTVGGFSFAGQGQNAGIAFLRAEALGRAPGQAKLVQGDRRPGHGRAVPISRRVDHLVHSAGRRSSSATPPASTCSSSTPGNIGHAKLVEARNMMLGHGRAGQARRGVRPVSLDGHAATQRRGRSGQGARARARHRPASTQTISSAWGGAYINDFIDRGRVKRVYIQADEPYRQRPEDVQDLYVRGQDGQSMAPFTAFSTAANGRTRRSSCRATTACRRSKSRARRRPGSAAAPR